MFATTNAWRKWSFEIIFAAMSAENADPRRERHGGDENLFFAQLFSQWHGNMDFLGHCFQRRPPQCFAVVSQNGSVSTVQVAEWKLPSGPKV